MMAHLDETLEEKEPFKSFLDDTKWAAASSQCLPRLLRKVSDSWAEALAGSFPVACSGKILGYLETIPSTSRS
jgi:hypothetical protein